MNILNNIIKSVFFTLFPRKCLFCNNILSEKENIVCNRCQKLYPYNDDYDKKDFFAPLMPYICDICILAWYFQTKQTIKEFKFNGNMYYGKQLAFLLCKKLQNQSWIKEIDYVVPVPLHKRKKRQRGFNQCEILTDIIAKRIDKKAIKNNLIKIKDNKEQHLSDRMQRYENIKGTFNIKNLKTFENKTVLLVDDVITTCATISECCKVLKQCKGIKIYVAAIASDRQII